MDESMKGVAVTVKFEYGCNRYPQNIGNYPPNNTVSCHRGQLFVVKRHKVQLEKIASRGMPPHQLQHGRYDLF